MRIVLQFAVFIGFLLLFFALTSDLSVVFAETPTPLTPLESTLKSTNSALGIFISLVRTLTAIAVALSFFYFFWNIALYIKSPGNKDEIRNKLVMGVVAITIATSIWGIVAFIRGTLGITNETPSPLLLPPLRLTETTTTTTTTTITITTNQKVTAGDLGGDKSKCLENCKGFQCSEFFDASGVEVTGEDDENCGKLCDKSDDRVKEASGCDSDSSGSSE